MPKATQQNNLKRINPVLAKEWHPTKNGSLTPRDVGSYSHKKVWWICSSGHEWEALISNRSSGTGCPYCSGRRASEDYCLETINPVLAKEWHPTKNGNLTPRDVTPGCEKKVWWICKNKHVWKASIHNRNYVSGCPFCVKRRGIQK